MNIDDLREKVTKAEEKVSKIEAKIVRHKEQMLKKIAIVNKILEENGISIKYDDVKDDSNWVYRYQDNSFYHDLYWAKCDVTSKESDIQSNEKQLREAQLSLKNWQEKLRLEEVKLQYIQDTVPQVIKDFLLDWKNRVTKYYMDKKDTFDEDRKQYKEDVNRAYFEEILENRDLIERKWDRERFSEEYDPNVDYEYIISYRRRHQCRKAEMYIEAFERKYDSFFMSFYQHRFDEEWLDKQLTEEMNAKLIDLMTRVSKVTGEILDASSLRIKDGNLNGFVIGKDGKAIVETIGAGGYNIQIYHYRTLVKPIK